MTLRTLSPEVLVADGPVSRIGKADMDRVKEMARTSPKRRARICAHPDNGDAIHEMLIVVAGGAYFQPHKHLNKSESFHMIEGRVTVVFFDDDGTAGERVLLGPPDGERPFYYRLSEARFHTVLVETDTAVFHETTNGPFRPEDTVYADWAPADTAPADQIAAFVEKLSPVS